MLATFEFKAMQSIHILVLLAVLYSPKSKRDLFILKKLLAL